MIEFGDKLEEYFVDDFLPGVVGEGTDPSDYIRTFDNHLHGFDLEIDPEPWPFLVATVRKSEADQDSEIGQRPLHTWSIDIYYVDVEQEDYSRAKERRSNIMSRVERAIEDNFNFTNFQITDERGNREVVYDSGISSILFDYSGQDEYHTFTSELYLDVHTQKTG